MKNAWNKLKQGKYLSLFMASLLLFTYLAGARYYLYENIYKAFNLGNLGAFGAKLHVSVLLPVLMTAGVLLGALFAFLTRKKVNMKTSVTLYTWSALFVIAFCFFTPYHLQLLLPAQILQNLAMINCIAVMVFSAVAVALLSWSVFTHLNVLGISCGSTCGVTAVVCVLLGFLVAVTAVCFQASFRGCVMLYTGILFLVNILCTLFDMKSDLSGEKNGERRFVSRFALAAFLMVAALVIGALVIENRIAL